MELHHDHQRTFPDGIISHYCQKLFFASGFELRLQDKTAGSFAEFADVANTLVEKLNEDPRIVGATSGFNPNFPQYLLKVDIAKAAKLGVNLNESMETLQSYIGSFYSSNFIRFGQMYKVMLQASYLHQHQSATGRTDA